MFSQLLGLQGCEECCFRGCGAAAGLHVHPPGGYTAVEQLAISYLFLYPYISFVLGWKFLWDFVYVSKEKTKLI